MRSKQIEVKIEKQKRNKKETKEIAMEQIVNQMNALGYRIIVLSRLYFLQKFDHCMSFI